MDNLCSNHLSPPKFLLIQKITYKVILLKLGGSEALGLKPSLKQTTVKMVLRGVKHSLVDTLTSTQHASASHASSAREHADAIGEGRRKWMENERMKNDPNKHFFVWSPEENAYFRELLKKPEMLRPGKSKRHNHEKLAADMNDHFKTQKFTSKLTIKHKENTDATNQAAKRMRKLARKRLKQVTNQPEPMNAIE